MTPDSNLEAIKVLVPPIIGIVSPFVAFLLGFWSVRSFERWKANLTQPVIVIQDEVLPVETEIDVKGNPIDFIANRLIVINKGGSGAKDCKVYIRFEENKMISRTGWMLPDDNTALTVTLNVNMPEYVDLCAISKDGIHFAITNERGFRGKPEINSTPYIKYVSRKDIEATVIVASSNTQPAYKSIIFHTVIPDDNNRGIVVKFKQASSQTVETPSSETLAKKATLYNWLTDWMDKK